MQVADNMAVSIHYKLTNNSGETLDSSDGGEALVYLHGQGNIIPGLEKGLEGKSTGDKLKIDVPPEEAYGVYNETLVQVLPLEMFSGVDKVEAGMRFHADVNNGSGIITVVKVDGDEVTIDGNHPLAGESLHFDVEVVGVRQATEDELNHGHVHGAGCNH